MAKRILITGAAGYIASVMIPSLEQQGIELGFLDQNYYSGCEVCEWSAPTMGSKQDIRDIGSNDLAGYDAIIHLAALSNDPLGDLHPNTTHDINRDATMRLARMAKAKGVRRFVFSSSCSTYGWSPDAELDETSPLSPQTPYGHSKAEAEAGLLAMADIDFEPVLLRHATVYGYAPMLRFDLVVNNLIAYSLARKQVFLKSDGQAWRPLVHVRDVAQACIAAATAPTEAVAGEVFNIGRPGENYRIHDVAQRVAAIIPEAEVVMAKDAIHDFRSYHINFSKAEQRLPGFSPSWSLDTGITELHTELGHIMPRIADVEGARYSRIAHIRDLIQRGMLDTDLRWTKAATAP